MIPLLLLAAAAAAPQFQDTVALDRAVSAFTGRPQGAEGGARAAIDARLRLRTCPTVALSWRSEAHDAVVVSCAGPDWRLFVPVLAPPAAAATAAAPRVAAAAARPELVIRRGDPVVIEAGQMSADGGGFSISREGTALTDAAAGARFTVKVDDAKGPVQAVAVAQGRATLPGWGE